MYIINRMINFNDLPCDIKKIIYAINKNKETEEYNNNKLNFNAVVQELETDFICEVSGFSPYRDRPNGIRTLESDRISKLEREERIRNGTWHDDSDEEW
tara:strand:+ start:948 stop:1244 length:297 start_codon:yes stop_codon:yes gene_type:complete